MTTYFLKPSETYYGSTCILSWRASVSTWAERVCWWRGQRPVPAGRGPFREPLPPSSLTDLLPESIHCQCLRQTPLPSALAICASRILTAVERCADARRCWAFLLYRIFSHALSCQVFALKVISPQRSAAAVSFGYDLHESSAHRFTPNISLSLAPKSVSCGGQVKGSCVSIQTANLPCAWRV